MAAFNDKKVNLDDEGVIQKYQVATQIATQAIAQVVAAAADGVKLVDLCALGDKTVLELAAQAVPADDEKTEKGIAFPTCVSVNNCAGNYSPLASEARQSLKVGDLVKVEVGAHVDGIMGLGAHSFVCVAAPQEGVEPVAVDGKAADVICAAYFASEAALRCFVPGGKASRVSEVVASVCEEFGCKPVVGAISHRINRFAVDDGNVIPNAVDKNHRPANFEFEAGEVYSFNVMVSTGDGRVRETDERTTVFRRDFARRYKLRLRASRTTFFEIQKKCGVMPFTLRSLDEKTARLGIGEITKHELVVSYPVLFERAKNLVAQFKFTVIIQENATHKLVAHALPFVKSDFQVTNEENVKLLQTPLQKQ
jgi:ERBB-3 binding protein